MYRPRDTFTVPKRVEAAGVSTVRRVLHDRADCQPRRCALSMCRQVEPAASTARWVSRRLTFRQGREGISVLSSGCAWGKYTD
jgi:hypothetical protein